MNWDVSHHPWLGLAKARDGVGKAFECLDVSMEARGTGMSRVSPGEVAREPREGSGIGSVVVLPPLRAHMEPARERVLPVPAMASDDVAPIPMAHEREVRDVQSEHALAVLGIHKVRNIVLSHKTGMILKQRSHEIFHDFLKRSPSSITAASVRGGKFLPRCRQRRVRRLRNEMRLCIGVVVWLCGGVVVWRCWERRGASESFRQMKCRRPDPSDPACTV